MLIKVICGLVLFYIAVALFCSGYHYKSFKTKGRFEIREVIDSLFFGFFGRFIILYYRFKKKCGTCEYCNDNRCKITGRFIGVKEFACKHYKRNK